MAKAKSTPSFVCGECGWTTAKWVGRCGECQAWGSVVERHAPKVAVTAGPVTSPAVPIGEVSADLASHLSCGVPEFDRVLGGGLVAGGVILLAGEPGVGKSTLLLEVAAQTARNDRRVLYVTGEESAAQVRLRADRTDSIHDGLFLAAETDLAAVLGHIEQVKPDLVVIDSVQTISAGDGEGLPGGVTQVREVAGALVRVAKSRGIATVLVGHVTKDGSIAGPRLLEHLVDVVVQFEGERNSRFRMVRAIKNRFGPVDEVGCFDLTAHGIEAITDPSGIFVGTHDSPPTGTCVAVTMEGRRPMVAEVQALVTECVDRPKRTSAGVDPARLAMIIAVLTQRCRVPLTAADVFAATVGGAKVIEPAADLALAVAMASASFDQAPPRGLVAIGEIGLAGELRRVPDLDLRLAEAARLGFTRALVPAAGRTDLPDRWLVEGLTVVAVRELADGLTAAGLARRSGGS